MTTADGRPLSRAFDLSSDEGVQSTMEYLFGEAHPTKTLMDKAMKAQQQRDLAAAEDLFQKLLQIEPNNLDALIRLAIMLMGLERFEESEVLLKHAVTIEKESPNKGNPSTNAARAYKALNIKMNVHRKDRFHVDKIGPKLSQVNRFSKQIQKQKERALTPLPAVHQPVVSWALDEESPLPTLIEESLHIAVKKDPLSTMTQDEAAQQHTQHPEPVAIPLGLPPGSECLLHKQITANSRPFQSGKRVGCQTTSPNECLGGKMHQKSQKTSPLPQNPREKKRCFIWCCYRSNNSETEKNEKIRECKWVVKPQPKNHDN